MSRYDMAYFNTLPLTIGNQLISKAFVECEKERAWDLWVSKMATSDVFKPFSEFFEQQAAPVKKARKSSEELLKDAKEIRERIEKGGG